MDPRFEATPSQADVAAALAMWPELTGKRLRPLFISAFGDIYIELEGGEVHVANATELTCERVAGSVKELKDLLSDPTWAQERLITDLALLADERGIKRETHQVFSIAPHPSLGGQVRMENLMPMDLQVWHSISTQLRDQEAQNSRKKSESKGFLSWLLGSRK